MVIAYVNLIDTAADFAKVCVVIYQVRPIHSHVVPDCAFGDGDGVQIREAHSYAFQAFLSGLR